MNRDVIAQIGDRIGVAVRQVVVLVSWATLYLLVVLGSMATLISVTTDWDPVIVTSGSMAPTLNAGDILFVDEHPEEMLGQNSVVTYVGDDGELITHRVFATLTEQSAYLTKGDANPTPDTGIVAREDVEGVGWLVVPYLGLPAVWVIDGNILALIALAIIALLAVSTVIVTSTRRSPRDDSSHERFSATAQRGVSRVRLVVAAMVAMLIVVNNEQFEVEALGLTSGPTLAITLSGLGAVSLLSYYRAARMDGTRARRFAIAELVGDTLTIVFVVLASGTSSAGWVLMALPIIEAAIHFRLSGAFMHWMVMSSLSIAAMFYSDRVIETPRTIALDRLEQLVDRLGVLLLVVIPASYLAEQLLGDVLANRRATQRAQHKTMLIEQVTTAGSEVARLDSDVFPALVSSALGLDFDVADCWTGNPSTGWHLLAQTSGNGATLPAPTTDAGGLRSDDMAMREVFIDSLDPDVNAVAELEMSGLTTVMRLTMVEEDTMHVVLRAGAIQTSTDPAGQATALRLLAAQASVALQNSKLLSEVRETHAKIAHQAQHDSLTDLANRANFTDVLGSTMVRDDLDHERTHVMFLDLNGFKAVNDRLGHNVGDALLRLVADRLSNLAGSRGMLARLGGDEFTILLIDENIDVADRLAGQIHEALSVPFGIGTESLRVGVSIGMTQGAAGLDVSEMLRRSDVAMYAAKAEGGRDRTMRYRPELDERTRRTGALEASITQAIRTEELHLTYQPVVTTDTGSIVGTEVLVRWTHPEIGVIPPNEILAIAETAGQVDELNAWIARRAMNDMATCLPERIGDVEPFVAINVSPREIGLGSLVANLQAALDESGLRASQVIIELSERIAVESPERIPNVDELVAQGMRLALDDFGQGHTSLSHLRVLPISCLKLDRALVLNAVESAEDLAILRSIVSLAHDLGYSVIAEGVETDEQLEAVRSVGAQFVQGFGLYRPMLLDDLAALFAEMTPSVEEEAWTIELFANGVDGHDDHPDLVSVGNRATDAKQAAIVSGARASATRMISQPSNRPAEHPSIPASPSLANGNASNAGNATQPAFGPSVHDSIQAAPSQPQPPRAPQPLPPPPINTRVHD